MVILVDRNGQLAQAVEAILRMKYNRENENFFYGAAQVPLSKWPQWRDAEINRILDSLEWFDLWGAPDGEYTVREGMGKTLARKRGDVALLVHISAKGNISKGDQWQRGTPCPAAWTPEMIAERWEEKVHSWRCRTMSYFLPEDCIRTWDAPIQKAARACLDAAAEARWKDALGIARRESVSVSVAEYLAKLVEG